MPLVCVIMPVFNAAAYVADAVGGILTQSLRDLELIAIDDGATDDSPGILVGLARRDARVRVIHQTNAGAVAALNRGIEEALRPPTGQAAAAPFIALMHADDLALPTRLHRQFEYFAQHPEVAICGTWITTFTDNPAPASIKNRKSKIENPPPAPPPPPREWRYPQEPRFTKPSLLFWCCFAHPTMMFRREVLEAGLRYDPRMPMPCEDYALWADASQTYRMGNVGEVLLKYRQHAGQGGAVHGSKTAAFTGEIRRRQIERLGIMPTDGEMALHQQLAESKLAGTREFVLRARVWLERLWHADEATAVYDRQAFGKVLAGRWAAVCLDAAGRGAEGVWPVFWECELAEFVDRTLEKNRPIPDLQTRA